MLAEQPDHPGAHHYRIHNWDYHEPEQALESARRYGSIAPDSAHALHMPGHIFSIVGMWNEAAISMDSATRREKLYMQERLTFPFTAPEAPGHYTLEATLMKRKAPPVSSLRDFKVP